ncbi:MAG: tRNA epoxyqueuosine(34) reductase QueG [Acidimicrobiales bacterium]|nr:tRNA epoxyqueuosine(34) reductase QueG [Acidimicrobiales bacterium]
MPDVTDDGDDGAVPVARSPVDSDHILGIGRAAGLDAVGIASAEPFDLARDEIERRRAAGLHAGMAFTFRNPARSTDPSRTLPSAAALVVGALSYAEPGSAPVPGRGPVGRVAKYSWTDHYARLREALGVVADELKGAGWRGIVLADDNALVDRAAAHRAGIGWLGKNANLLLPGQGSWFVLGAVLTDAPLDPVDEPVPDGCGSCTQCLEGCPTGAIIEPGVVDARRCLAWLVQAPGSFPHEHREALGDRIYGCDDCQDVCPPNRRVLRQIAGSTTDQAGDIEGWVPLLEMLASSDDELLERHGRWYIPQRDPAYLRRNALLALANVADPDAASVRDAVAGALVHHDALVRSHAVWAARRLGYDELTSALADDPDPSVQDELAAPAPTPRRTL